MNKNRIVAVSILTAGLAFSLLPFKTSSHPSKFLRAQYPISGRYIVVLNDTAPKPAPRRSAIGAVGSLKGDQMVEDQADVSTTDSSEDAVSQALSLSSMYGGKVREVYDKALKGYSVEMSETDAEILSQDARVKYVEEDAVMTVASDQVGPPWGLDRSDQRALPLNGDYNFTRSGVGVNAYIIDTGIRVTHSEFTGRADMAYNAVKDGSNTDCNGHGTHVSGTIGGITYGVAKNVMLHGVRVLDCNGNGALSDVISGVNWVTRHAVKPAVANMSLSGGPSASLDDAINSSMAAGITYVVAAGNGNTFACDYSPSRIPGVITVGATDDFDNRAYFTNYGTCVDIFAPGVDVTSAWATDDNATFTASGTSMASPHVAGTVALYLEANRGAQPAAVSSAIVSNGTTGLVKNLFYDTPNVLLYTEFASSATCQGTVFQGTIDSSGSSFQTSLDGFAGGNGLYSGILATPPTRVQYSLSLERKKGSRWTQVASINSSNVSLLYNGSNGFYRWRVSGNPGSTYNLCAVTP